MDDSNSTICGTTSARSKTWPPLIAKRPRSYTLNCWRGAGTFALQCPRLVALVRERSGGKVVRADRYEQGGRAVYRIRVLTADGRVREYRVDATTGAMH